jgi:23S rRNA-/tRNA-specific pseudouridylate synthase
MHQIRVHLTSIWHPVVWDKTYGNKSLNHYLQKELWVARQLLHASKIEFTHYWNWKKMTLEARLKDDMKWFIEKIK